MQDVVQRTKGFVENLQSRDLQQKADHVIVISHGGTMKAMLLNLCGKHIPGRTNAKKYEEFGRNPRNCEMCCFRWAQPTLPYSISGADCHFLKSPWLSGAMVSADDVDASGGSGGGGNGGGDIAAAPFSISGQLGGHSGAGNLSEVEEEKEEEEGAGEEEGVQDSSLAWLESISKEQEFTINENEILGSGASTTVYAGRFQGEEVAVKVFDLTSMSVAEHSKLKKSMAQELQVLTTLNESPRIIRMFGCLWRERPSTGSVYTYPAKQQMMLLMERAVGGTVAALLDDKQRPLSDAQKGLIIYETALGMKYLHSKGVMHRDLKSVNLLLNDKGSVKVSDFGINFATSTVTRTTRTSTTSAGTTVPWMGPEQLMVPPAAFTEACDVYSLGIVMGEVLTRNTTPYPGLQDVQVYSRQWRRDRGRKVESRGRKKAKERREKRRIAGGERKRKKKERGERVRGGSKSERGQKSKSKSTSCKGNFSQHVRTKALYPLRLTFLPRAGRHGCPRWSTAHRTARVLRVPPTAAPTDDLMSLARRIAETIVCRGTVVVRCTADTIFHRGAIYPPFPFPSPPTHAPTHIHLV
jgi:serine/threonine protein kinase